MGGLRISLLIPRRANLSIQDRLNLLCALLWLGRCSCGCAQVSTRARREDDNVSTGPVGKQLWPRARMPAMTAALKEPLKPQTK